MNFFHCDVLYLLSGVSSICNLARRLKFFWEFSSAGMGHIFSNLGYEDQVHLPGFHNIQIHV